MKFSCILYRGAIRISKVKETVAEERRLGERQSEMEGWICVETVKTMSDWRR